MYLIEQNIDKIKNLCNKYKVSNLYVFGSILTEQFNKTSDVDFVVDFNNVDVYNYADNYFGLKTSLERLLKRQIDLLEAQAIKNPYLRQSIDSSKRLIYES